MKCARPLTYADYIFKYFKTQRGNVKCEVVNRERTAIQEKTEEFSPLGRVPARLTLGQKFNHTTLQGILIPQATSLYILALSTEIFPINTAIFPFRLLFYFEKSASPAFSAVPFIRTGTNNMHTLLDTPTHQQLSWGRRKQAGSFQHGAVGRKQTRQQRQAVPSS